MAHDGLRARIAHPWRQQVSPELRTEQVAHVFIVRVEHDAIAHPNLIGSTCQKTAAGAGVAADSGYGQLRFAAQYGFGQIIDGVDIGP